MHPDPETLRGVRLFAGLTDEERGRLAAWLDVEDYQAGKHLAREGVSDYAFFVLDRGRALVTQEGQTINTLGPGDVFGEVAFFGDGRRTATVIAETDVRVLTMFGTRFREMQRDMPDVAEQIEALALSRKGAGGEG